tara:strand:- start:528 stop:704 length:177 start_codon:yes stop_codon:yes gene_type:complete
MRKGIKALSEAGYRWIVVHPELFANDKTRAAHNHALGEAIGQPVQLKDKWVWEIPQSP